MTKLDEMYATSARQVLSTDSGRDFLAYILRKLKYCDIIEKQEDINVRNAGIKLLEDLICITGIKVNVLKIE
jgi:hypothetical protein